MATYYVDPAASGDNDGSSWANAWTSLQSAADTAEAGDIVYCRGAQTLAAAIDFDTNSGSDASGYIKFIGCNASGANDGTHFVLDGNSTAANAIVFAANMVWLENIKVQNCTSHGIMYGKFSDYWNLINVWLHSNEGYGLCSGSYARYWRLFRCAFTSNTWGGVYRMKEGVFFACRFAGNTDYGLLDMSGGEVVGCVFDDNARGLYLGIAGDNVISNCVFHANATVGLYENRARSLIFGCRFSDNGIGYNTPATAGRALLVGCYFGGNTTDIGNRYDVAPIDGSTAHVITGGTDTDDGYVNSATGDFNLDADEASLYSEAITLP